MRLKIGALALVVFFLWLAMPPLAGAEDGEDLNIATLVIAHVK